jgi:hypothetical protein
MGTSSPVHAGTAPPHREGAEVAQLDAIARSQRFGDLVEYRRQ